MSLLDHFDEIWCVDFEFYAPDGSRQAPLCMAAREIRTGRTLMLWVDDLVALGAPPFDIGSRTLLVAYYASAELGCFKALNWPMPVNVLDLYAEFRCQSNGLPVPAGRGLIGALTWFGLDSMTAAEKDSNRQLILRGGPYSADEKTHILRYCGADVDALAKLLAAMSYCLPPQAILRGRYMRATAEIEWNGIPIDTPTLDTLRGAWIDIQDEIIAQIDVDYGIYDGRTFKQERFARWLHARRICWPLLDSGRLALNDETFKQMAKMHPEIAPLRELRTTLGKMRLLELAIGPDGRNRHLLSAYGSRSSRNTPSNTKSVYGPAKFLRGLIKPEEGTALAYVDWCQQEFGIAAALSGDPSMQDAYRSGDPYLGFAKAAAAVPPDATKQSHPRERELFKTTTLGVQYCMTEVGLASSLNISIPEAKNLLALHRQAFPQFWRWSDAAVDYAMLTGKIHTIYGWTLHVAADTNPRSLRNFPMQGNGAEIMRLACCLATNRGIKVCTPVHDALLVEGPSDCIEDVVATTQAIMKEAGQIVLNGFELASEAKIIRAPNRFMDARGEHMWNIVTGVLAEKNHGE